MQITIIGKDIKSIESKIGNNTKSAVKINYPENPDLVASIKTISKFGQVKIVFN